MASATLSTDKGDIVVDLFTEGAPKAANNFLDLARKGFYDGVIFHRIVPGFVIQGGDPTGTGRGGPGYTFEDEPFKGDYYRGTLAMANAGPNTNGSQFFICLADLVGTAAEELHDLRPGDEGHGCRGSDRRGQNGRQRPAGGPGQDPEGDSRGRRGRLTSRAGLRPRRRSLRRDIGDSRSARCRCNIWGANVKEFSRHGASKPLAWAPTLSTVREGFTASCPSIKVMGR